ncbi:MAG: hypothetical protein AAF415_02015 [Pseudomonadota bacterium]
MSQTLLAIVGVFAGIAICIGTLYSLAQMMMSDGWTRAAHIFAIIAMTSVMWFLLERDPDTARMLSPLLVLACIATFWVERRWYRIFPILQVAFAGLLLGGYVQF